MWSGNEWKFVSFEVFFSVKCAGIRTRQHSMMSTLPPLLLLAFIGCSFAAIDKDEVTSLPGLSWTPSFKHYSGYLKATGSRQLHYWFLEAQSNPQSSPVVLWLNGGPGCSSMDGLLSEHGPFLMSDDGVNLRENPYSWNKVANMLYLEAPAGVGYSYSADKQYNTSDDQVSMDNYQALKYFFANYEEFSDNEFYVTGESYGGVYVPTLSVRIAQDLNFNFKGFAVGNGLSDVAMNANSVLYFMYYHGLFPVDLWTLLNNACCKDQTTSPCDFTKSTDPDCANAIGEVQQVVPQTINIYNIYDECHTDGAGVVKNSFGSSVHSRVQFLFPERWIFGAKSLKSSPGHATNLRDVPPCINVTAVTKYLNSASVRTALHIPSDLPTWVICSDEVIAGYNRQYTTLRNQYNEILSSGKYRILVYNGDIDMACNFLGDQWFVDSLKQKIVKEWHPWFYESLSDKSQQVAGFSKIYNNIQFVTIKGAGHMVPTDKPVPAFEMFSSFIQNKPL